VHVVGQDDPAIDMERGSPAHLAHGVAQRVDAGDEQVGTPVEQVYREEVSGPRDPVASIVRHSNSMPKIRPARNALMAECAALFRPTLCCYFASIRRPSLG
jgi:hypothetical protein